ncbi:hypothetical protein THAOC_21938, partial [Thalassiosira oceanica]
LGFNASSSFGLLLLRGLTWSLPPWSPLIPLKLCPATNSAAKYPPSWLELLPSWLNSIDPWSPTLLSLPCPLMTWSPLVFLKLRYVRLLTDWSPTYPPLTATATGPGFKAPSCFWSLTWSDMVLLAKAAVRLILPWLMHLSQAEAPVLGPRFGPNYSAVVDSLTPISHGVLISAGMCPPRPIGRPILVLVPVPLAKPVPEFRGFVVMEAVAERATPRHKKVTSEHTEDLAATPELAGVSNEGEA